MKNKLIAIVLALFSGSGLLATDRSLSGERAKPPRQSFVISKYGTLLDVFEANGNSRFGKLQREGFNVRYEMNGKKTSAFAIGTTTVKGLKTRQVEVDWQSASMTVTTSDEALEITSYFILDEVAKKLTIHRRITILNPTVSLLRMTQFVDEKLIVGPEGMQVNLLKVASGRIKAGSTPTLYDCQMSKCTPLPPPCDQPWCPPVGPFGRSRWYSSKKGNVIALSWKDPTALASPRAGGPAKEVHFVTEVDLREKP